MIIGFVIWSIVSIVFLAIGIGCRRANEATGFFTFTKPPTVENVKHYNNAVSILWIVAAGVLEIAGIPLLFLKQNSPLFIPVIFVVMILIVVIMVVYIKIEIRYKK